MSEQLSLLVKSALMKAWRDHSSEITWGIYLKQAASSFPPDSLSNLVNLAEIILQQAVVGSSPNSLMLSYLKHTVVSNVVSYSTALSTIVSISDYDKHHTMIALLDLVEYLLSNLRFCDHRDSGLPICKTLHRVIHWLLEALLRYLQFGHEIKQLKDYCVVMEKVCGVLHKTVATSTLKSLIYLARAEEKELFRDLEQCAVNVRGTVTQMSPSVIPIPLRDTVVSALNAFDGVTTLTSDASPVLPMSQMPICSAVNVLVSLEAILNPINNTDLIVEQLLLIHNTMSLSTPELCSEVLRACMMGLVDSRNTVNGRTWAGFTFLKMPQMLVTLNTKLPNFSQHLEQGFDKLLNYAPLLDLVDTRWSCDSLQIILTECHKYGLVNERQTQELMKHRRRENKAKLSEAQQTQSNATVIVQAAATVSSILKTLDEDYAKSMDGLLSILSRMLKSFDLLLAAAAAHGQLLLFTRKLIKFNEFSKQSHGENIKMAQCRLLVFDISFIMLCNIIQLYGIEILDTMSSECGSSFFVQWAQNSLPENDQYKCLDECAPTDPNKIELMLTQVAKGGDIKYILQLQKWHDACTNAPFIIQEILFAWEHGVVNVNTVKNLLDSMRSQMCCLSIVVAAHVCSYINTAPQEVRDKALFILNHLTSHIDVDPSVQYYKERLPFMIIVLERMISNIVPSSQRRSDSLVIPATSLPFEILETCMMEVFTMGWLTQKSLDTLKHLLNLCGSDWMCDSLIGMLCASQTRDTTQITSILFATFHMDLEHMTLSLLTTVIPRLLTSPHSVDLREAHGAALAKLCVLCVAAMHTCNTHQSTADLLSYTRRGRKRSLSQANVKAQGDDYTENKRQKAHAMEEVSLLSEGFNMDMLSAKEETESNSANISSSPLTAALDQLFTLFGELNRDLTISPRSNFIVSFIREAVNCGQPLTKFILQSMQTNTVSKLLMSQAKSFSDSETLRIFDLSIPDMRSICALIICQNTSTKL